MRKWKLRWFSVVLAAVLMITVVPSAPKVYAAGEGELTQYMFHWKEQSDSREVYFVSEYAYDLGNGCLLYTSRCV